MPLNCDHCPIDPVQFGELLATIKHVEDDVVDMKKKLEDHIESDKDSFELRGLLKRENIVPILLLLAVFSGGGAGVIKVLEKLL